MWLFFEVFQFAKKEKKKEEKNYFFPRRQQKVHNNGMLPQVKWPCMDRFITLTSSKDKAYGAWMKPKKWGISIATIKGMSVLGKVSNPAHCLAMGPCTPKKIQGSCTNSQASLCHRCNCCHYRNVDSVSFCNITSYANSLFYHASMFTLKHSLISRALWVSWALYYANSECTMYVSLMGSLLYIWVVSLGW